MSDLIELPPEDSEYLDGNHENQWRIISDGGAKSALLIESFPIPSGYDLKTTTLMILIPSGYPGTSLDMFYFNPPLVRSDGAEIPSLTKEAHFDITWQRWSRHYTWEPGRDSLTGHVEFVKRKLHDELR